MKIPALVAALSLLAMSTLPAADSKLDFQPSDTVATVLTRLNGQVVELRMRGGEKISGKVEKVGDKLVHLSALTGQEFYEAAVALDGVAAVVVRAKK